MSLPRLGPDSPLRTKSGKTPTAKALRRLLVPLEKHDQANLFAWAEAQMFNYPELDLMYAIPNAGGYTGGFKKNKGRVIQMRKQGVKKGVPDIHLPVARRGWNSLYIELKREDDDTLKPDQEKWAKKLREANNCVALASGFVDACDILVRYLRGENRNPQTTLASNENPHQTRREQRGPTSLIGES